MCLINKDFQFEKIMNFSQIIKASEVTMYEDDYVKLSWEKKNDLNYYIWKTEYEPLKILDLEKKGINTFFKRLEWNIDIIILLISFYKENGRFYFLKLYDKTRDNIYYLGFVTFIKQFIPYLCKEIKCNGKELNKEDTGFIWYLYSLPIYKTYITQFFGKSIKFIDLVKELIRHYRIKTVWLKSDNRVLLQKVYTKNNDFYDIEGDCQFNRFITFRSVSEFYKCMNL